MSYFQNLNQSHPRVMGLSITVVFWLLVAVMGRLLPHPPNVTPLTSLSLMAGVLLSERLAFLLTIITLFFSDILIGIVYHYPLFGSWSLFTYSGFAVIALLGSKISTQAPLRQFMIMTVAASLGYWLWTNGGVWLMSGMYPYSGAGFLACYIAAIPFLRNALCGDLFWMWILFTILRVTQNYRVFGMILHFER